MHIYLRNLVIISNTTFISSLLSGYLSMSGWWWHWCSPTSVQGHSELCQYHWLFPFFARALFNCADPPYLQVSHMDLFEDHKIEHYYVVVCVSRIDKNYSFTLHRMFIAYCLYCIKYWHFCIVWLCVILLFKGKNEVGIVRIILLWMYKPTESVSLR